MLHMAHTLADPPARAEERPRREVFSAFARTRAAYEELCRPRPIRTPAAGQEPSRKRTIPPITPR
jgi:hypothetical protein